MVHLWVRPVWQSVNRIEVSLKRLSVPFPCLDTLRRQQKFFRTKWFNSLHVVEILDIIYNVSRRHYHFVWFGFQDWRWSCWFVKRGAGNWVRGGIAIQIVVYARISGFICAREFSTCWLCITFASDFDVEARDEVLLRLMEL